MTQEELKNELYHAAANGLKDKFEEISKQLEQTIENRVMINMYSNMLIKYPRVTNPNLYKN